MNLITHLGAYASRSLRFSEPTLLGAYASIWYLNRDELDFTTIKFDLLANLRKTRGLLRYCQLPGIALGNALAVDDINL